MVVQMVAGMFVGAVLASLGWGLYVRQVKNRAGKEHQIRDELMHELGDIWVDIDSLVSSFRSGMMDERTLRALFSEKVELINHILKPNMHTFEVYFVKYMEVLVKEYSRIVYQKDGSAVSATGDFASEMETSLTLSIPEQTDLFTPTSESAAVQKTDKGSGVAHPEEAPVISTDTTISEPMQEIKESSQDVQEEVVVIAAEAVSDVASQSPAVSDEVDSMFEDAFSAFESPVENGAEEEPAQCIGAASEADESIDGVDGEEAIVAEIEQEVTDETIVGFDQQALFNNLKTKSQISDSLIPESKGIDDEDFTMETLMDVDLSTIASITKEQLVKHDKEDGDFEKRQHFELIQEDSEVSLTSKTELEVVIATDATHADEDGTYSEQISPPEETKYNRIEAGEKPASQEGLKAADVDEDFEVIIPDSSSSEEALEDVVLNSSAVDSSLSDSITGDDVADKIAALEKSAPLPSAVKEPVPVELVPEKEPVPEVAPVAKQESKPAEGKKPASHKESEEAITGDDVATQIDSFFGLFK